jgi:uncharacterized membrane protein (GlpM family)
MSRDQTDHRAGDGDRVRLIPSGLARTRPRDWVVRFAFGAGVSALAGVMSLVANPRLAGVFLAFPAVLLASLTLIAKEEGLRPAREEAFGATFGTIGMIGFATVTAVLAGRWPLWATLSVALLTWAVVAFGSYLLARSAGGESQCRPRRQ